MAKISYYGSKISNNITRLDNGCLLCTNVPIARIGSQKYLAEELGMDGSYVIEVFREPEEVFSDKTIASFNGKAFTDTHPSVDVTSDNWAQFAKGEITNTRKGVGENEGMLVADILVRDPVTINEIESGAKREVSAGYTCEYIKENDKVYQRNIVGNHVALVQHGRAGPSVKIYDAKVVNKNFTKVTKINDAIRNLE